MGGLVGDSGEAAGVELDRDRVVVARRDHALHGLRRGLGDVGGSQESHARAAHLDDLDRLAGGGVWQRDGSVGHAGSVPA